MCFPFSVSSLTMYLYSVSNKDIGDFPLNLLKIYPTLKTYD